MRARGMSSRALVSQIWSVIEEEINRDPGRDFPGNLDRFLAQRGIRMRRLPRDAGAVQDLFEDDADTHRLLNVLTEGVETGFEFAL